MKKYILALDEGTTSARAILFDRGARIVSMAQHEFTQIYPRPGWVEHDAMEIYADQYAAMTECIAKSGADPDEIAGIGITNQRETTVVWERESGKPICNAIVWQCRRTADICEELAEGGHADDIRRRTGLRLDAYFSGTKLKWILDHIPGARERAKKGELLFGTIDTWLLWKLTNGRVHATDRTNASRTMLYGLDTGDWDDTMLELLDIPRVMLPSIRSSSEIYGSVEVMGAEIPICGIAGDQQSALFGQRCFSAGEVKTTYGTGCFLLAHTGNEPVMSDHGLLTTVAATQKDDPIAYALEGSVFVGGAVIQWLRDELRMLQTSSESEALARSVKDSGGVYIVPAFAGLGAPYWDMHARGTITGLTRGSGRAQIVRSALEAIAYQTEDLLSAMSADIGRPIDRLKVDGGASANNFLMQFQADISGAQLYRPATQEATAAGAAYLAGLASGFFESIDEIAELADEGTAFHPSMEPEERGRLLDGWHRAVAATRYLEK